MAGIQLVITHYVRFLSPGLSLCLSLNLGLIRQDLLKNIVVWLMAENYLSTFKSLFTIKIISADYVDKPWKQIDGCIWI